MSSERFQPHAADAMASMFDDVSGRYDALNRLMTLGQDGAWRQAMWRQVPGDAHAVLDLCTGSGVSLPGLRRPGRIVLGVDVSFAMLERAQARYGGAGWAPRLACADAFRLPLRAGALDAITVAFGVRNLRPRQGALAELARVLRPGGTLVVLEAAAPAPGPAAFLHAFWLRSVVPLAGRLSGDPTAYRYLSESIFEFGDGQAFERDLQSGGFALQSRRAFLLGATRLWVARRAAVAADKSGRPAGVQVARTAERVLPRASDSGASDAAERRAWQGAQALISAALAVTLLWAVVEWLKFNRDLPLTSVQRLGGWCLLLAGLGVFAARTVVLALRYFAGSDPD